MFKYIDKDINRQVGEGKVEIYDAFLKRQLYLTTEDLRFVDYIVRMVTDESTKNDAFQSTGKA